MAEKAVCDAIANMKDAVMGVGVTESLVGINRRELSLDGAVILGQNPWGPFNKEMTVIAFKGKDGEGIGCMIHYGAHCTSAGGGTEITRDWAGGMCDALENECGMPVAFFAGQTGDTGPRLANGKTTGNIKQTEMLAGLAGIDAARAYRSIKEYTEPKIYTSYEKITIPYQPLMTYDEAKAKLDAISKIENPKGRDIKAAAKYRDVMEIYEKNLERTDALEYEIPLVVIGSVAFAPFPFEVFSEIAIRIAHHSPFKHTLILNNTNGSLAYFPTKGDMPRGGYEVFMFNHFCTYVPVEDADTVAVKQYVEKLIKIK